MSVSLNLVSEVEKKIIDMIVSTIETCLNILIPKDKFCIALTLCDDEHIKNLNNKFRNINSETDVLSFPLLDSHEAGKVVYDDMDIDFDTNEIMLGDIVISYERAVSQAQEFGHSLQRELCYLAVHSILHLVGYDHADEEHKKTMRNKEEEILKVIGTCRG